MALTIGNRTIIHRSRINGTLSDVGNILSQIEAKQDPSDTMVDVEDIGITFQDKVMEGYIENFGANPSTYGLRFSTNGAGQLATMVLPARFFSGLKELALRSPHGADLADQAWQEFARDNDTRRMVRTVLMNLPGGVQRVVRSVHSTKYARYSHSGFVNDMLSYASNDFTNLPVVDWFLSDNGLRLRFVDGDLTSGDPLPMIEAWNSETGNRKVGVRGGVYHSGKEVAFTHWDNSRERSWIHRGDRQRIRDNVNDAFQEVYNTSHGVVAAYVGAAQVAVESPFQFLEKQLKGTLTKDLLKEVQSNLNGETLEACVDAVALTAASKTDLYAQADIESAGAMVLNRGTKIAAHNNGVIS